MALGKILKIWHSALSSEFYTSLGRLLNSELSTLGTYFPDFVFAWLRRVNMSYNAASRGSCTSGEHLLWIYCQLILPCRRMGVESVKIDYSLLMIFFCNITHQLHSTTICWLILAFSASLFKSKFLISHLGGCENPWVQLVGRDYLQKKQFEMADLKHWEHENKIGVS